MARNKKRRGLNEKTRRGLVLFSAAASVIAAIAAVIALIVAVNASSAVPKKPEMQNETLQYSRVQDYAQRFLQVWIMGRENDAATLEGFYSAAPLTDLNANPATITDITVADLSVAPTDQGEILWSVTLGTTMDFPGVSDPSRNFYEVSVLQKDESLTIAKLPEIVELDRGDVSAQNAYTSRVASSSPLYQVAVNFVATYLTPQASESFGRYVTAEFEGEPLKQTPYSGAQVVSVATPMGVSPEQVGSGEEVSVMIRVRASTSNDSYQTMDIPVTAVKQANGQWLISSMADRFVTARSTEDAKG